MEKDNNKTFGLENRKVEVYAILGIFLFTVLAIISFIKNTSLRAVIFATILIVTYIVIRTLAGAIGAAG